MRTFSALKCAVYCTQAAGLGYVANALSGLNATGRSISKTVHYFKPTSGPCCFHRGR